MVCGAFGTAGNDNVLTAASCRHTVTVFSELCAAGGGAVRRGAGGEKREGGGRAGTLMLSAAPCWLPFQVLISPACSMQCTWRRAKTRRWHMLR